MVPPIVQPPVPGSYQGFDYAPHLQLPYTLQWNASIEQALGMSQALTVSYVGAHASRVLQTKLFFPSNNPNASSFEYHHKRSNIGLRLFANSISSETEPGVYRSSFLQLVALS